MRMIDADKLKIIIEQNQLVNSKLSVYDVLNIIDAAPTVYPEWLITTVPVTLSDNFGHVREAYYDASRELIFTEAITRELLNTRHIKITEKPKQLRTSPQYFYRYELEGWLYEIAHNNIDGSQIDRDFAEHVEEIIKRLDGFERFIDDKRREAKNEID